MEAFNLTAIKAFFAKLTVGKKLLLLLTPIITVLMSIQLALFGLLIFLLLDLVTGVRKSFKEKELKFNPFKKATWLVITSQGFRKSWVKATEYGIGVIVTVVLEALFFNKPLVDIWDYNFTITEIVIGIAISIAIYSIFENLRKINPESKFLQLFNKITPLVKDYLWDKLRAIFKK